MFDNAINAVGCRFRGNGTVYWYNVPTGSYALPEHTHAIVFSPISNTYEVVMIVERRHRDYADRYEKDVVHLCKLPDPFREKRIKEIQTKIERMQKEINILNDQLEGLK
jgi:hypothetical protein